jgi:hypothetical protein
MAVTMTGFCGYARLDDPALMEEGERGTAELCLRAAVDHARGADIPVEKLEAADNAKYELYIYAIANHFYDNRAFLSLTQSFAGDEYTKRVMTAMRIELESEGWL